VRAVLAPVSADLGDVVQGGGGDVQVDSSMEVGGAQRATLSDMTVCSSLGDSVGSAHDIHHIFFRVLPAPAGRGAVSGLL